MANAKETSPACTKCGLHPRRVDHWGKLDELCTAFEEARVKEINDILQHFQEHRDECCCHTYLGRESCMAPIHGDIYRASCIEHGDRFYVDFRAKSREEAKELGEEQASAWGGECIRVTKVKNKPA